MALEVWMLTALIIVATICIGVVKGILGDSVPFGLKGPRDFFLDRLTRYGDPFTISLIGGTYTVVSSPEAIKFVLSTAHTSFPVAYLAQYSRLLVPEKFADKRPTHFREILLSAASGEGLQKLVPFISSLAEKTVKSWENQAVVNSVEELQKFAFHVGMHVFWKGIEPGSEEMDQIRNEISRVGEGLAALPINFPGFSFHKALKAKQVLNSRLQNEISRRRKAGIQQDDVLNSFMSIGEVDVSDSDVPSMMVGIMYSASATMTAFMPWVLKYLDDFPEVHQRVQEEQDCLRQKMIEEKSLTWFKPKRSMPYTLQVIYEIMRIESVALLAPRQANKDVDYNGIVFRKGSYVWTSNVSLHYDPKYYPNPHEFNPSRFVEKPNPKVFVPFGQGPHLCPGIDLALTETMFIIHHLLTNYKWKRCGPETGVTHLPLRKLKDFPICLAQRCIT